MAVARNTPNTILLGSNHPGADGGITRINEYVCGATPITPGDLIELVLENGARKWRPHNSATAIRSVTVALELTMQNKTINDAYTENQLVEACTLTSGCKFYGRVPSGANISLSDYLQSNGNGMMKEATASTAAAGVAFAIAGDDAPGAVIVTTRLIAEVI